MESSGRKGQGLGAAFPDPDDIYDLAIIGGGVNGCGIARDAAGRGAKVLLLEQDDLASGTSSASTKLIHGGLRYLELFEFRLVREALREREILLRMAPHIIWPLRFVLPHHPGLRPAWMLRLGLFLYDHLGGRHLLPGTRVVDLRKDDVGRSLKPIYKQGFEYSDCWVDDARLVVLNAQDAARRGAKILTRTKVVDAVRADGLWVISARRASGEMVSFQARALVNAAGPWVIKAQESLHPLVTKNRIRLVKGSHIVVPRKFCHSRAYIFQNGDRRIFFAIPYEQDFTLIGTTDLDFTGDPALVGITPEEVRYLCEGASGYFEQPVRPEEVVWSYSGVRPLQDDGVSRAQDASRDYVLSLDHAPGLAPLLNVFGGKITTYRRLSEAALAAFEPFFAFARAAPWTEKSHLPGGEFAVAEAASVAGRLQAAMPGLDKDLYARWAQQYGLSALDIIKGCAVRADLGTCFGADLYEVEVRYLMRDEWAQSAVDVLWRRTKLGLRFSPEQRAALERFMKSALA